MMAVFGSPVSPISNSVSLSWAVSCSVCDMFSYYFPAVNDNDNFTCDKCRLNARLTEKIAELETRIRNLYEI